MSDATPKPVFWVGSARSDLRSFPEEVRTDMGFALWVAQRGGRPAQAKTLKGIVSGAGVLELAERHDGDTYRVVYTVRFADAVYVLHAFQKKSKRGIKTPRQEIDLIRSRLKAAEEHYGSSGR
ncbi:MAG: type II toxin-antitoxin system RelE/ParE family toxin [Phycisphaerales bacterium]